MTRPIKGSAVESFIDLNCTKLATDNSGWEVLYKAMPSNEYWLLTYPDSSLHGGGEPLLTPITAQEAKEKFNV